MISLGMILLMGVSFINVYLAWPNPRVVFHISGFPPHPGPGGQLGDASNGDAKAEASLSDSDSVHGTHAEARFQALDL